MSEPRRSELLRGRNLDYDVFHELICSDCGSSFIAINIRPRCDQLGFQHPSRRSCRGCEVKYEPELGPELGRLRFNFERAMSLIAG